MVPASDWDIMSLTNYPHAFVPNGFSEGRGSATESILPCLRQAYPLPEHHGGDLRFQLLLDLLAQSQAGSSQSG